MTYGYYSYQGAQTDQAAAFHELIVAVQLQAQLDAMDGCNMSGAYAADSRLYYPYVEAFEGAYREAPEPAPVTISETRTVLFHVRSPRADSDSKVYVVAAGRFNMALCDQGGAVLRTFIPETDSVADILAKLNAEYPGARSFPFEPCADATRHVSRDALA